MKNKIKRVPKRGHYDVKTINGILDSAMHCHVGFVYEGYPVVIPTAFGRKENTIYIHGSTASRMMKSLADGIEVCLTVTKLNGIVLAKSAFHHSMNYESVVIFGKAKKIESGHEKLEALKAFSDHLIPGRWEEVRLPNEKEMKATMVLKLEVDDSSAKIRTGGPVEDKADEQLPIWSGVLPIQTHYEQPVPAEKNRSLPPSVSQFYSGLKT